MPKYLVFLLLLLPLGSFAQFTISGRVLNYKDKQPVANADVFLNNATGGSNTVANGSFRIDNVKPGKYFIIVSIIGYIDFSEQVQVTNGDVRLADIYLTPSNKTLKEVVVKPKEIPAGYLYVFKQQFLGKDEIAQDCKIINPEILDITYNPVDSIYKATSDGYMIIENPDLGYIIKFELNSFAYSSNPYAPLIRYNGYARFEEMKGKPSDVRRWQANRFDVYKNSARHFYRALMADRLTEEGFKAQQFAIFQNPDRRADSVILKDIAVLKEKMLLSSSMPLRDSLKYLQREMKLPKIYRELRPFALSQRDLLYPTDKPGLFAFTCDTDRVFVYYNEKGHFDNNIKFQHLENPHNTECTLISFNQPFALMDRDGVLANPASLSFMGFWVTQRTADLLPVDYDPPLPESVSGIAVEHIDSTVSKKVITGLNNYNTNHVTEKAYLHFDRSYYGAGDTMFFKAYVTTGDNHLPSALSNVLHVDLIDNKGRINRSISLGISEGIAWGDLALPDSLAGGNYRVRAYTEWMRNKGQEGFFNKIIPVVAVAGVKAGIKSNSSSQVMPVKPDVQFFPEGGNWVPGIKTKMAFKAVSPNGYGVDIKGNVTDNTGKTVGFFISEHKGMGCFYITGEAGKTYKANVTYPNGSQDVVNLPALSDKGITMAANNDSPDKIGVTIMTDPQYLQANKDKDYTLVIYSNGIANSTILKLDQSQISTDIYKRDLHSGVARLTLFAPAGEPLCERLVFVENFDELKLKISADKPDYVIKGKVTLTLNALDEDNAPTAGHFSVAVTDENKLPADPNNENTILSNTLLTSELKGYVEQPGYYFNTSSPEVLNNLDVLMLTQGYSSFEWKQVFDDNKPVIAHPAETSLSLTGTMKTMSGKPIEGGTVTLFAPKHSLAKDTTTDSNGNFKFTGLYLTDTTHMVLHGHMKNNSDKVKLDITYDIPAAARLNNPDTSMTPVTPEIAAAMKKRYEQSGNMKTGILLKQVDINRKAKQSFTPELTHSYNLNGPGAADQVIMGDQLLACPNLRDCLKSLLHGVLYDNDMFFSIRTHIELLGGHRQPMVFIIDGIVSGQTAGSRNDDVLDRLTGQDIYSVEVLVSQSYLSIYGSAASGGAIVITTRHGGEGAVVKADGSVYYTFHGFEKSRTFYSPKYDITTPPAAHPDQRTTIYWQPELTTDNSGNADFEFFNSADPGTYRVVVEGMDGRGNIGRHVYHYTVK